MIGVMSRPPKFGTKRRMRPERRLGQLVEHAADRGDDLVARIDDAEGVEPGEDRAGDDDPRVDVERQEEDVEKRRASGLRKSRGGGAARHVDGAAEPYKRDGWRAPASASLAPIREADGLEQTRCDHGGRRSRTCSRRPRAATARRSARSTTRPRRNSSAWCCVSPATGRSPRRCCRRPMSRSGRRPERFAPEAGQPIAWLARSPATGRSTGIRVGAGSSATRTPDDERRARRGSPAPGGRRSGAARGAAQLPRRAR